MNCSRCSAPSGSIWVCTISDCPDRSVQASARKKYVESIGKKPETEEEKRIKSRTDTERGIYS